QAVRGDSGDDGTPRNTPVTARSLRRPSVGYAGPLLPPPRTSDTMAMPLAAHRFTVDEYHRMAEAGVFHEDDRLELIDGLVVEMSPNGPRHAACGDRLTRRPSQQGGARPIVPAQTPIVPRPDP